jgi:hypothetical protein
MLLLWRQYSTGRQLAAAVAANRRCHLLGKARLYYHRATEHIEMTEKLRPWWQLSPMHPVDLWLEHFHADWK